MFLLASLANAQSRTAPDSLAQDLEALVARPAPPGYEWEVTSLIRDRLEPYRPIRDNLGSVIIRIGEGEPRRLIVTPIDEPSFVVSRIMSDGYLQLHRLPALPNMPWFNELHAAQPMLVAKRDDKWIPGAMAGLSGHLQQVRSNPPDMGDIENLYLDVGASSAAEVRKAGVDLLSPVSIQRNAYQLENGKMAGAAVGDRFGAAVLLELLRQLKTGHFQGSITLAFVTQNWTAARGLVRLLDEYKADDLIFIGRFMPTETEVAPAAARGDSGLLIGLDHGDETWGDLGMELKSLAAQYEVKLASVTAAPLLPNSRLPLPPLPSRTVHLSVPMWWPVTPCETISLHDVSQLVRLLTAYLTGSATTLSIQATAPSIPIRSAKIASPPPLVAMLKLLVETSGVSNHEAHVREAIQSLLPSWAHPTVDKLGNLILDWGDSSKAADVMLIAHMDEIGYQVKSLLPDGRLELQNYGGGRLVSEGHVAMIHSDNGQHPGVLELPQGWQVRGSKFNGERNASAVADVGAANADEVARLGIRIGDFVTVPKKFLPLLGSRALGRSFDDRVGCSALISAVWKLGPHVQGRRIRFVWSTGEEIGLLGAAGLARELATAQKVPRYVFAVDDFVSSDSPLESKRFADALVGRGFVIRAVDNSTIVPQREVGRLRQLMASKAIPTQFGITGGTNDGGAFVPFGSVDIPLGVPLRYSHSPAEIIDTRDVESLARAVFVVARYW